MSEAWPIATISPFATFGAFTFRNVADARAYRADSQSTGLIFARADGTALLADEAIDRERLVGAAQMRRMPGRVVE